MPNSIKISTKKPTTAPTKSVTKTLGKPAVKPTSLPSAKQAAKPLSKPAPAVVKPVLTKIPFKTSSSKTITKPVAKPVSKNLLEKPIKAKKIKLVRDSFTIPKPEYLMLDNLKLRAADLKHPVKKGELIRAGIKALAAMTDPYLLAALKAVPMLKTGRPSK